MFPLFDDPSLRNSAGVGVQEITAVFSLSWAVSGSPSDSSGLKTHFGGRRETASHFQSFARGCARLPAPCIEDTAFAPLRMLASPVVDKVT